LSFLRHLTELKELGLGSYDNEQIEEINYNRFAGSLRPLQNLVNLKELNINDTNLDSGLEYLPDSLEKFSCSAYKIIDAKVKAIYNLFANKQGIVKKDGWG